MAGPRGTEGPQGSGGPELLRLAAYCGGHRCAALRRLADEECAGSGSVQRLRDAVRAGRSALLVELGCVGQCQHGSVVLLGRAHARGGSLSWAAAPDVLAHAESASVVDRVCRWVAQD